jgi:malate dehydrogenase (oxaloacetate-decarboxylating)
MNRAKFPQIDIQYRLKTIHRPGSLAQVFKVVGDLGGLIGDIHTKFVGKDHSIRDVTISVYDDDHLQEIRDNLNANEGVDVQHCHDIVFEQHLHGKVRLQRTREIKSLHDLRHFYTPGVARVCKDIEAHPENARKYTSIGNTIAIVTNGSRVLGLGDIGPEAAMPVMEGKAMIYDQFVGVSAIPILLDCKSKDEFVRVVECIAPTFAGIHLEDIRVPDCFDIENELIKKLKKPVMHDDQHGTATVCLAAILSALRLLGRGQEKKLKVAQIGLGAAGFGIAKLLFEYGFDVVGVDPDSVARERLTKIGGRTKGLDEALKEAEIVVATTGRVGLITKDMIRKGQMIFALSNPVPEIDPDEALAAGAIYAADGQVVNNALGYPGLFRAALNVGAQSISPAMKIAAARAISDLADKDELLPSIFNSELHQAVVKAVEAAYHNSK